MKYWICLAVICLNQISFSMDMETLFKEIKQNPNTLQAFIQTMPKGGQLHYHLLGGIYPENLIESAEKKPYCLNHNTYTMYKMKGDTCLGIPASELTQNKTTFFNTVKAWSMKDFKAVKESAHDHFFQTFYKTFRVGYDLQAESLAQILRVAAEENELYLEVLMDPNKLAQAKFVPLISKEQRFSEKQQILLKNKSFQKNITKTMAYTKRLLEDTRRYLGCSRNPLIPACMITVKFQYYVLRNQSIDDFFIQALGLFAAASLDSRVVGINVVQQEDLPDNVKNYYKQMQIFHFLHQAYPTVHISLHAGELSEQMVEHLNAKNHIFDAIFIGQAERIGHGVAIMAESNPEKLLTYMATKPIPVEINLTSNETILGLKPENSPLPIYLAHQVPIVLSTDDEGVLRTGLSKEYIKAINLYHLDYQTLKAINRNTLTYAFLPGKSLWKNPRTFEPVPVCENLKSDSCLQFVANNPKANLQRTLELRLNEFEKNRLAEHQQKDSDRG